MQVDPPILRIFQQPYHGYLLPVSHFSLHVEKEYSHSLSRGLERYFLPTYSEYIKIAKSRTEGDSRLLVPIVYFFVCLFF